MRPSFKMLRAAKTDSMSTNLSEPIIIILLRRERRLWPSTKYFLPKTTVKASGIKRQCKWPRKQNNTKAKIQQLKISKTLRIEYKIRILINQKLNFSLKFNQETNSKLQMLLLLILLLLLSHIFKFNMKRLINQGILSLKSAGLKVLCLKIGSQQIAPHLQMKEHLLIKTQCKKRSRISSRYQKHKRQQLITPKIRPKRVKG